LGPAESRRATVPQRAQPVALFAGGKRDISCCPSLGPMVGVAVAACGPHPVLRGEIVGILDAKPALFGRVHQEQSAERPKGLSAKALFAFLVDDDDALAGICDFRCRDQPCQAAADHDYVCVISHRFLPRAFFGSSPRPRTRSTANGFLSVTASSRPQGCLFQFGSYARGGCSGRATLNLNLF